LTATMVSKARRNSRAYSDDTDDRKLTEIKSEFIVMFEPDMDSFRRVEVSLVICGKKLVGGYSGIRVLHTGLQNL
jgi:hypothetical protein